MDKIIKLGFLDFDEILAVWEESVQATHLFITAEDIQIYKPLIYEKGLPYLDIYGIKKDGNLAGFMALSAHKIEMLFLRPAYIGQGLGKQFLNFAIHEKGRKSIGVNEENPRALAVYMHMGFQVVRRDEVDDCGLPHPVLQMRIK